MRLRVLLCSLLIVVTGCQAEWREMKAKLFGQPTEGSLTLTWNGNPDPSVVGYRIYCGKESRVYAIHLEVTRESRTTTIEHLPSGTYYCAVTAYDHRGRESGYSPEVSKVIP